MYVHPAFQVHHATALAFAGARGFGLVIACEGGRPVASPLPFRLIEANGQVPKLEFHVARANELAGIAEKGGTWMVSVMGYDAYVSPDWYVSAEQVPTWLYETVQLSGPVSVIPASHTLGHTERLSNQFEAGLAPKPVWTMDKVSERRLEMLSKAIVTIEMTVETVEGNFKLNQHKQDADHVAIAKKLNKQFDHGAKAIAARMVALRPHLDYGFPTSKSPAPALEPAAQ